MVRRSGIITTAVMCMCAILVCSVKADEHDNSVTDSADQYFDMYELRVLGNTRLPQREIETWLYQ
ncbi:MAG: hypothetical protein ABUL58_04450, partial [Steroidobacter sp.]